MSFLSLRSPLHHSVLRATGIAVFLGSFALLPASAQERDPESPGTNLTGARTKTGAFLAAHGGLLIKDFYDVGSVSGDGRLELRAVVFTPPGHERAQVRALRLEVTGAGKPASSASGYVDLDEIEALSSGLKHMIDLTTRWKNLDRQEYTEVEFATRDQVRIGFYQRRKSQGAFIAAGEGDVQVLFDAKDLPRLKALVDDALRMLRGH